MWIYEKKLQYPVKIKTPNPALAKLIITQLGGPDVIGYKKHFHRLFNIKTLCKCVDHSHRAKNKRIMVWYLF